MENRSPEQEEKQAEQTSTEAVEAVASTELTNEQRVFALCVYLVPLLTGSSFIAPLIIWLLKKGEDSYVENHAKESLNFQISFMIYIFIAWLSLFVLIGVILFPAVVIAYLVFTIIASIKAYKGEEYRVPVCIRFIK